MRGKLISVRVSFTVQNILQLTTNFCFVLSVVHVACP